jgi:hypothetical protein
MAKTSGLAWTTCSLDDSAGTPVVIKNDVTDLSFATPRGVQDITGIDKSAFERLLLLADFTVDLKGVFNSATSHTALKTVPSTSVNRTLSLTVAGATLNNEVIITDYALSRSSSGELTWSAPGVLSDGTVPTWS